MRQTMRLLGLVLSIELVARCSDAFEISSVFGKIKPPEIGLFSSSSNKPALKEAVLKSVSFTSNGSSATTPKQLQVASVVRELETANPPNSNLLSDAKQAKALLDGVWYLQYTQPSNVDPTSSTPSATSFPDAWKPANPTEGDSRIETKPFNAKGTISAGGVPVVTANRVVQQIFDIDASRVTNKVETEWGTVVVGGTFRASSEVTNRAIVGFDQAVVSVNSIGPFKGFDVDISGLFALRAFLRGGNTDAGWLEVTFVDEDLRIGRGNKGTLFVLTRDPKAVQP